MRMLSTLIVLLLLSLSTYGYAEEASKSALEVAAEKTVTDGNTVKKKKQKDEKICLS